MALKKSRATAARSQVMLTPVMRNSDARKSEIVMQLLLDNNRELIHWRDRNWAVFRDTAAGLIGLAAITKASGDARIQLPETSRYALAGLPIVLAILVSVYLLKNFRRYQERREIGARLETALQVFESGAYLLDETLYPMQHQQPKASKRGTHQFIVAIWLLALAVSVVLGASPVAP